MKPMYRYKTLRIIDGMAFKQKNYTVIMQDEAEPNVFYSVVMNITQGGNLKALLKLDGYAYTYYVGENEFTNKEGEVFKSAVLCHLSPSLAEEM